MKIHEDRSHMNIDTRWFEKGYIKEDVHSLRLQSLCLSLIHISSTVCWTGCDSARRRKHLPYFACGGDSGGVGGLRPF